MSNPQPLTIEESLARDIAELEPSSRLSEFKTQRLLRQCSKITHNPALVWFFRGVIYSYAGRPHEMIEAYEKSINEVDSFIVRYNYSVNLRHYFFLNKALKNSLEILSTDFLLEFPNEFDKIIRCACMTYNFDIAEQILLKYGKHKLFVEQFNSLSNVIAESKVMLEKVGISSSDANKLFGYVETILLQGGYQVEMAQIIDVEDQFAIYINVEAELESILKMNDELFDLIYKNNLLDQSYKIDYMFRCSSETVEA